MTTTVTKTIRASGGDYTTLSAWEAALPASLVANDEAHVAVCYNDWPSGLNNIVDISGFTADATRYAKITVAEGHRHNGIAGSGFFINAYPAAVGNWLYVVRVNVANTVIEYLDVVTTRTSSYSCDLFYGTANACLFRGGVGPRVSSSVVLLNSVIGGSGGINIASSSYAAYTALNCVSPNYPRGTTTQATVKNCIATATSGFSASGYAAGSDYNASFDTSASIFTHNVTSITSADFVDSAGGDYHLASGSALIGEGTNLYGTFTADIDGDTRPTSGAWDIGFDHYAAAASAVYSDLADAYSIRASTSTDLADSYAIRAAIASDLADAYAIRAAASSDLSDSYFLRAAIAADLADSYSVRASVLADLSDTFGISAAVAADLLDAYLIRATATTDLSDSYSIAAAIAADLADSYEILSSGVVTSDLADSYTIRAAVSSDFADSYSIRAGIVSDLADSYTIRTAAASDLSDTYAIIVSASADMADSYVIRAAVSADLADGYSIGDAVALPCPSAAEIAEAVWSHASGTDIAVMLAEAWGRLGLDPANPLISGQTEISFGAIVMALTGNETSSTLTRQ